MQNNFSGSTTPVLTLAWDGGSESLNAAAALALKDPYN
jgi:hypothetical protein